MAEPVEMTGGCACGRVRFTAQVESDEAYLCHCRMCQRASGSVSLALHSLPQANVRWEGAPDWFDSSPIAHRPYCSSCGTSLGFAYLSGTDKMDLTVASFDDPCHFVPKHHFGAESIQRPWLDTRGLPEHRSEDYKALVDRWVDATGRMPE